MNDNGRLHMIYIDYEWLSDHANDDFPIAWKNRNHWDGDYRIKKISEETKHALYLASDHFVVRHPQLFDVNTEFPQRYKHPSGIPVIFTRNFLQIKHQEI